MFLLFLIMVEVWGQCPAMGFGQNMNDRGTIRVGERDGRGEDTECINGRQQRGGPVSYPSRPVDIHRP